MRGNLNQTKKAPFAQAKGVFYTYHHYSNSHCEHLCRGNLNRIQNSHCEVPLGTVAISTDS